MEGVEGVEARIAAPSLHPQSLGGRPQLLYLAPRRRYYLQQHHVLEGLLRTARRGKARLPHVPGGGTRMGMRKGRAGKGGGSWLQVAGGRG